jgi:hypothetical protein
MVGKYQNTLAHLDLSKRNDTPSSTHEYRNKQAIFTQGDKPTHCSISVTPT